MHLPSLLRRIHNYYWQGPAGLPRALKMEWRFVAVRWLGIAFVAPGLLLANLPTDRLLAAYLILVVAGVYNYGVQRTIIRRPEIFASGYLTTLGDSLLNIAMVSLGGGFDSPFYYILYTVTISVAMRYGYGPSMAMTGLFVAFDALEGYLDHRGFTAAFVFRSGFLAITSILAVYLREEARRAENALERRLRQADMLNEATALVASSLEFEPVLRAVAAAAAQFFGGERVVLRSSTSLTSQDIDPPVVVHYPEPQLAATLAYRDLERLCAHHALAESGPRQGEWPLRAERLPTGEPALVLTLVQPSRQLSVATLAVALPAGPPPALPDADVLDSFVERMTLAIENASLYRALARRTEDVQRAYADLASAHQELLSVDEMKTNFLANVSHELRTPLTSIRGFSELLLTYDDDISVQREFLEIINSESERLTRLVNDVLDITKIESGQIDWHMTMVDLGALLQESGRAYAILIERQALAFELDIPADLPPVYGDRDRLQQVVSNLLNNAMKFTTSGSIRLAAARVGDEVWVSVADTGIGIAEENLERIFEKFQQVGAMLTEKPHGTGLGLAICREIVEHHKGRLWVESELGAGSTFTFALPLPVGEETPPPADEPEPARAQPEAAREPVAPLPVPLAPGEDTVARTPAPTGAERAGEPAPEQGSLLAAR